jgi:poly(hydroxyalkanoate) depolymerase family esterase
MRRISKALAAVCAAAASTALTLVLGLAAPASAASLTQVTNFGPNPGGAQMYVYVPDSHPANPAIVVALHGCGGSGPGFYSGSEFASLADRYGFIVIYPSAEQQAGFGKCWDTWSDAAKVRGGGSDPVSLASMVTYTEQTYHGDPNRVYVTGSSSGGMMTDEMLALYPDVFKAGAAYMGVPFDCFANAADYPPGTSKCTSGTMVRTPQQWGDEVRAAYPGYTGPRPPIQLWHGTADTLVPYQLLQEDIKQWTNVFGLSQTPTSTDTPVSGWSRSRFADSTGKVDVEAYSIQGAGHVLPEAGMAAYAIHFFGLDGGTGGGDTTPPSVPSQLAVSGVTASTASLSWTASTDNVAVAGYRVYRNGVQVGTASGTTFTDTGLSAATQYTYTVAAYDAAGNVSAQSPGVTATTSPGGGGGGGGCTATYAVTSQWGNGFTANVTVTNNGTAASTGWKVSWTWSGGQQISNVWNGVLGGSGSTVVVTNATYNGSIPPGGNTVFGFQAGYSGTNPSPTLTCTTS